MVLNDGDIVYIESRETEVFYTGGLLQGGEFPLPRDYDLDVLGAMAIAGQGAYGSAAGGGGGGGGGLGGGLGGVSDRYRRDNSMFCERRPATDRLPSQST